MAVELYDEHEQGERVRRWLKEYGPTVVIGIALAFSGIFGYRYWQDHQVQRGILAAEYFDVIEREVAAGNVDFAEEQFEAMRDAVGRHSYVSLAGVLLASAWAEQGMYEPAIEIYREVLDQRRMRSLWPVATLRLARLLDANGDTAGALALLDGEAPTGFRGAWAELRGDLLMTQGRLDEARTAYREAMNHQPEQGGNTRVLQMKIDATGPGLSEEIS